MERNNTMRLIGIIAFACALGMASSAFAQTVGHGANRMVELSDANRDTTLLGGRADMWKALRWCVSVESENTTRQRDDDNDPNTPDVTETSTTGATISVKVQYQKQKHLLCEIVPGGTDICSWFSGTEFAIDNSGKLNDWHTTLNYTAISLGAADGSGNRTFDQDGVSGTITTDNSLTALTVNKPGRVSFVIPSTVALTAGGGTCS